MEAKKTKRADLQNRRVLFMEIGLVVALSAVAGAFAWGQPEKTVEMMTDVAVPVDNEVIVNTQQDMKPPEVKTQAPQVFSDILEVVKNDTQIDTNYDFSEFTEEFAVETPVFVEEVVEEIIPSVAVQQTPTFQGGTIDDFRNWVQKQLRYPQLAIENGTTGTVNFMFVINTDGTLADIQVLSSPDRLLEEEATRVLKSSPKWVPGKHNNRPVRVMYTLPVKFELILN